MNVLIHKRHYLITQQVLKQVKEVISQWIWAKLAQLREGQPAWNLEMNEITKNNESI